MQASDEKPLIETVDARTEEEKKLDEYRKSKMWKTLNSKDLKEDKRKRFKDDDVHTTARHKRSRVKTHESDSDLDVKRPVKNHSRTTYDSDSDLDLVPRKSKTEMSKRDSDSDLDIPRSKISKNTEKNYNSDSDLEVERSRSSEKPFDKVSILTCL